MPTPVTSPVEAVDEAALVDLSHETVVVEVLGRVLSHLVRVEDFHCPPDSCETRIWFARHLGSRGVDHLLNCLILDPKPFGHRPERYFGILLEQGNSLDHGLGET